MTDQPHTLAGTMTGPEHYAEAEQLLEDAARHPDGYTVARAHVHATLALAAATALGTASIPTDSPTAAEWRRHIVHHNRTPRADTTQDGPA